MKTLAILALVMSSAVALAADDPAARLPDPPVMPARSIAPGEEARAGEQVTLNDRATNFTLFIPKGYAVPASGEFTLTIHFHTAVWFSLQEHLRRGCTNPIVAWYGGEGSATYRVPFEDRERLARWLRLVEAELTRRGGPTNTRATAIEITSFSAGYGAVREIVKQPEYRRLLRRVILCDSIYGGLDLDALKAGRREVAREHVDCWLPLAREAMAGEKDFTLTLSAIPTGSYASSWECADAIVKALELPKKATPERLAGAAPGDEFPLTDRADAGRFHVWYYAGTNAMAHMTHPRHMADVWKSLDAVLPAR